MIIVYEINTGEGYYNGVTANPKYRFRPSAYKKERKLYELILKYGWKAIKRQISIVGEFEERLDALKLEDKLIMKHRSDGDSLNEYRSGYVYAADENKYRNAWTKKWRAEGKDPRQKSEKYKEYRREYMRKYRTQLKNNN